MSTIILAAMRATLGSVLTAEAYARTIPLAERWTAGVRAALDEAGMPWHVTRLGCRAEYLFGLIGPATDARRPPWRISPFSASRISTH